MKQFLYVLTFAASVGTIGIVATNPQLVQQGASLVGVASPDSPEATPEPEGDHLAKFLSQYPYANKGEVSGPLGTSLTSDSLSPAVSTPPFPPTPPPGPEMTAPPLPPLEMAKIEPPPIPPLLEPPLLEPPPLEPPPSAATGREESQPFSTPPMPPVMPVIVQETTPPLPEPIDTFSTEQTSPIGQNVPFESAGMASTRPPETGFASSGGRSGYEQAPLDGWSDPVPVPRSPQPSPPVVEQSFVPPPVIEQNTPPEPPAMPDPAIAGPRDISSSPDPFLSALSTPPQQNTGDDTAPIGDAFMQVPLSEPPVSPIPPPPQQDIARQPVGPPVHAAIAVPMMQAPPTPPMQQPQPKVASQFQINPSVVAREIPCHGTETIARVGTEVILMCDVLPQLRRAGIRVINENLKKMTPEERAQIPQEEIENFIDSVVESQYPAFLQEQIRVALVYNDFFVAKSREEREMFEKKFGEEFDQKEVPEMVKEFGVRDIIELKQFLKDKLGSSLESERRIWIRSLIAHQWIMYSVQGATGECTHDEMMEYYQKNKDMFTSKTRAQWQELFVAFSNHKTERDAETKIAWMGNRIAAGYPLDEIAKRNSDGFTADKGGLWDWTQRGSLASQELEDAIFSQPVGVLSSKIIRSEKGYHLVRVVKREDAQTTPFIEAQVTIRDRIRMQRRQKYEQEYFEELNRRYPTIVFKEKIDFDLTRRTADVFEGRH